MYSCMPVIYESVRCGKLSLYNWAPCICGFMSNLLYYMLLGACALDHMITLSQCTLYYVLPFELDCSWSLYTLCNLLRFELCFTWLRWTLFYVDVSISTNYKITSIYWLKKTLTFNSSKLYILCKMLLSEKYLI